MVLIVMEVTRVSVYTSVSYNFQFPTTASIPDQLVQYFQSPRHRLGNGRVAVGCGTIGPPSSLANSSLAGLPIQNANKSGQLRIPAPARVQTSAWMSSTREKYGFLLAPRLNDADVQLIIRIVGYVLL